MDCIISTHPLKELEIQIVDLGFVGSFDKLCHPCDLGVNNYETYYGLVLYVRLESASAVLAAAAVNEEGVQALLDS